MVPALLISLVLLGNHRDPLLPDIWNRMPPPFSPIVSRTWKYLHFLGRGIGYFRQMSLGLQEQIKKMVDVLGMEKKFQHR